MTLGEKLAQLGTACRTRASTRSAAWFAARWSPTSRLASAASRWASMTVTSPAARITMIQ
ncbi:MAG TPA: hypothetical protein VII22_03870 [Streptosporangiaceae bacterium]